MDISQTLTDIDTHLLFRNYDEDNTYLDIIIEYFCDDDDFYYIIPIENIINNCMELFPTLCNKSVNRLLLLYFKENTPLNYIDKIINNPEFIDIYIKTENDGYDTSLIFSKKFMKPVTYCISNNVNIIEVILSKCSKYCESIPEKYITHLFKLCNNVIGTYEFECPYGKYKMSMLSIITTWWLNTGKFNIRQYYDICRNIGNLFEKLNIEDFSQISVEYNSVEYNSICYFNFLHKMKQWKALFCIMEYLLMSNEIKIFEKYLPIYNEHNTDNIVDYIDGEPVKSDFGVSDYNTTNDTYLNNNLYNKYKILSLLHGKYMDNESDYEIKLKCKSIDKYLINDEFNKYFVPLLKLANIKISLDLINILCNKVPKITIINPELYNDVYERYDEINTINHFIVCCKIDKEFIENILVNKVPLHYYVYSNIQLWMLLLMRKISLKYIFNTFKHIDSKKINYKTKFKNNSIETSLLPEMCITDYIFTENDIMTVSKYIDGFEDWLAEINFKIGKEMICIICQEDVRVIECIKCHKDLNWLDTWTNNICGNCDDTLSNGYNEDDCEILLCHNCGHKGNGVYHKGCLRSWMKSLKTNRKREKAQLCVACNENMMYCGSGKEHLLFNEVFSTNPLRIGNNFTPSETSYSNFTQNLLGLDNETMNESYEHYLQYNYDYSDNDSDGSDDDYYDDMNRIFSENSNNISRPRASYIDTLLPQTYNFAVSASQIGYVRTQQNNVQRYNTNRNYNPSQR